MRCKNCNREYYIKWMEDDKGNLYPVACGDKEIEEFANEIIEYSKLTRRKL